MPSLFSKIIAGEIPCYRLAESDDFFAFLDISPLAPGHTLVVPKMEEDYIFHLNDDLLGRMMVFAKKLALTIEKVVPCQRIGVAVIGLEVPHVHIHLIPINRVDDINFARPKLSFSPEEFEAIAAAIRAGLPEESL